MSLAQALVELESYHSMSKRILIVDDETNLQRIVIPVEGVTCVTCEIAVRNALKKVSGVVSTHVSVGTKNATIDYDPAKTDPELKKNPLDRARIPAVPR